MKPSRAPRFLPDRWVVDPAGTPRYGQPDGARRGRWTLCEHCGVQFPTLHHPGVDAAGRVRARYCSNRCTARARWARVGLSGRQDAFSEVDEREAWVIGLFWADGCIEYPANMEAGRVTLDTVDFDMGRQVAEILGTSLRSKAHRQGCKPLFRTYLSGLPVDRLAALGMSPTKTTDCAPPAIERGMASHFIRGFFDGDGTVGIYGPPGRRRLTSGFVGTKEMLEWISATLAGEAGFGGQRIARHSSIWHLRFNHYDSLRLAEFMYGDGGPCLGRKFDKFTKGRLAAPPRPGY